MAREVGGFGREGGNESKDVQGLVDGLMRYVSKSINGKEKRVVRIGRRNRQESKKRRRLYVRQ